MFTGSQKIEIADLLHCTGETFLARKILADNDLSNQDLRQMAFCLHESQRTNLHYLVLGIIVDRQFHFFGDWNDRSWLYELQLDKTAYVSFDDGVSGAIFVEGIKYIELQEQELLTYLRGLLKVKHEQAL